MIAFILAGLMLYGPYLWCHIRKESLGNYGLTWTLSSKAIIEVAIATTVTLIPLTPLAMRWPGTPLPRDVSLTVGLELSSAGAVAAVVEEVFFRGWIQTLIGRRTGRATAIVLTAFVFAASHLFLRAHWLRLATFFPGLIMGILKERHGSVAPSAIYHFLGNLWSIWFFPDMPI